MPSRARRLLPAFAAVVLATTALSAGLDKKPKPSVSLRASPQVGFSPLRVVLTAELTGGLDDFEEFYCPSIEWNWGDDTKSESKVDCDPYEAGKSAIRRRFSAEHLFRQAGTFQVYFRMKQRDKVVASGSGNVQVRAGMRDEFDR